MVEGSGVLRVVVDENLYTEYSQQV